jgi:hypothetical protein
MGCHLSVNVLLGTWGLNGKITRRIKISMLVEICSIADISRSEARLFGVNLAFSYTKDITFIQ